MTNEQWFQEMRIRALKASRNLHQHFAKYLLGQMTWDEFVQICKNREADFESSLKLIQTQD